MRRVKKTFTASHVESYQTYKKAGKADLIASCKPIVEAMPNGVVFARDNVNDVACTFLKKHNIMVVRRTGVLFVH